MSASTQIYNDKAAALRKSIAARRDAQRAAHRRVSEGCRYHNRRSVLGRRFCALSVPAYPSRFPHSLAREAETHPPHRPGLCLPGPGRRGRCHTRFAHHALRAAGRRVLFGGQPEAPRVAGAQPYLRALHRALPHRAGHTAAAENRKHRDALGGADRFHALHTGAMGICCPGRCGSGGDGAPAGDQNHARRTCVITRIPGTFPRTRNR